MLDWQSVVGGTSAAVMALVFLATYLRAANQRELAPLRVRARR